MMTQTTEQKILTLVGISVVWIIVLLIIFREIGWYVCIPFFVVYAGVAAIAGIPLPEKPESELCGRWYLAFSEQELADPMHKKLLRGNGADYRHLYK